MARSILSASRFALVLVSLVSLAAPRLAIAADPTAGERELAKAHFKRGRAHQDAGAYDLAIAQYQAAYALVPLPELLFNIGQCYRLGGSGDQALVYYERYLEEVPTGGASDDARQHVETLRAAQKDPPAAKPPGPAEPSSLVPG